MPQAGITDEREISTDAGDGQKDVGNGSNEISSPGYTETENDGAGSREDTSISQKVSNVESTGKESSQDDLSISQMKEDILEEVIVNALEDDLLALNAITIKNRFPKSYNTCKDYMAAKSQFPPDEETMIGVLLYTPRNLLYDFFDTKDIFVNINHLSKDSWSFHLNFDNPTKGFAKRALTESAAFYKAFEELEKQL